ncbi:MAG: GTPase ObgE, partial [Pseudomonadota bacterium]
VWVGIGDRFLGHVERTRVLLHLVSAHETDVADAYQTVRREIELYGAGLENKTEILALSQVDAMDAESIAQKKQALSAVCHGAPIHELSSVAHRGTAEVLHAMADAIAVAKAASEPAKVDMRWQNAPQT